SDWLTGHTHGPCSSQLLPADTWRSDKSAHSLPRSTHQRPDRRESPVSQIPSVSSFPSVPRSCSNLLFLNLCPGRGWPSRPLLGRNRFDDQLGRRLLF